MHVDADGEPTGRENATAFTGFVLLGFSDVPHLQWVLFGIFLFMYLTTLTSNGIIIVITKVDSGLQTPMYFFLRNFSFLEICYVTTTVPRMLMDLCTLRGSISALACATQMCFSLTMGSTECLLLTAMAYDRYVAICHPLRYAVIMSRKFCAQLVAGSWLGGIPAVIGQTWGVFSVPFCGSNRIKHFFCDIPPVLKLACGDTSVSEKALYVAAVVYVVVPSMLIIVSYGKIVSTILKMSSSSGRAKAFSTCSSHLVVVVLFYGTATITYLQPKPSQSGGAGKVTSLFYTILIPTLNPLIYTLRNKDIVVALRKLLSKLLTLEIWQEDEKALGTLGSSLHAPFEGRVFFNVLILSVHCPSLVLWLDLATKKTLDVSMMMARAELTREGKVCSVRFFILLGFSDLPNLQGFLFIYLVILTGNGLIVVVTRLDPALHRPMYFFLANFSALEICYVSVTLPRILFNLWTQKRAISILGCATQLCFFLVLGATESFLLAVMSYDRYVAICNPLHYPLVMNPKKCAQLAAGCLLAGIPVQIGQRRQIFSLRFCDSEQIKHFFCDIPPILKIACGDTAAHEASVYVVAMLFVAVAFLLILVSYSKVVSVIVRLPTARGRAKAFSTCSSHLLLVLLFYGSATITYLRPKSSHSPGTDKLVSLFYTIVTPMFNPVIYSLRNRDVIAAQEKLLLKM
ncbi:LOW QUALITY PROTEIN: uncharacterized protein ACOB6Z_010541 [Ctenodactylus gundi]